MHRAFYPVIIILFYLMSGCVEDQSDTIYTFNNFAGWINVSSGVNKSLNGIYFVNAQSGWIVGQDGVILHSTDGGQTWSRQNSNSDENLNAVYFYNEHIGWVVGGSIRNGRMRKAYISKTADGGNNWMAVPIPYGEALLTDVLFADSLTGWVSGYSKQNTFIIKTNDGGNSWETIYPKDSNDFKYINNKIILNIDFADNQYGWVVGENILMYTTNGGINWIIDTSGSSYVFTSVDIISSEKGWFAGWGGLMWQYYKIGDTTFIKPQVIPSSFNIYDIRINNQYNGWCVGNDGFLFFTQDGGNQWVSINSKTGQSIFKIFFIDELNGWIIGNRGMIFRTTTGGL